MKNVLTIDVEEWFQTNDFNIHRKDWSQYESRIEESTNLVLDIISKTNSKATFYFLGCVAQKNPDLVRKIHQMGYEIGSHGMYHEMINKMTPGWFEKDLSESCNILEEIIGEKIVSFRAPSWSIDKTNIWALEILEDYGILCDSSFQPFATPLSGDRKLPMTPFHPVIRGRRMKLLEVPSTVVNVFGIRIPFAGGAYFRFFPELFIHSAINIVNKKRPSVIYIHPWETDINQPRIKSSAFAKFVHYNNLRTTKNKFTNTLQKFEFISMRDLLLENTFASMELCPDELKFKEGSL